MVRIFSYIEIDLNFETEVIGSYYPGTCAGYPSSVAVTIALFWVPFDRRPEDTGLFRRTPIGSSGRASSQLFGYSTILNANCCG